MIYDICTFNGEVELFEIRYNILKSFVDEFRVIEFDKTFSGKPKQSKFNQKWDKVKHYFITEEIWGKYEEGAKESPNTEYGKGAKHWQTEFMMKESIKSCLTDLKDGDIVFVGDTDEIWENVDESDVTYWENRGFNEYKLKLRVYSYYLNNRSNEEFYGTLVTKYKNIKDNCLNHLRTTLNHTQEYRGWHFTSMGGHENVKKKLTDSYTNDSYANDQVLDNLQDNISNNKDFLGRDFTYKIDEENWPQWLKENKDKYKHLCLKN